MHKWFFISYIFKFCYDSLFQILDKKALQDLVKEVDPTEELEGDVEDVSSHLFSLVTF